jgi:hypothetical protein
MRVREKTLRPDALTRLLVIGASAALVFLATFALSESAQAQTLPPCPPGSGQALPPGKTQCRPLCEVDASHPIFSLSASVAAVGTASGTFSATALNPANPPSYELRGPRDCATATSDPSTTWDIKHYCPMPHCVHWHTYIFPGTPGGGTPYPSTAIVTVAPDSGSHFLGWSAECAVPTKPTDPRRGCATFMDSNKSVEATLSDVADSSPPTAPVIATGTVKRYSIQITWPTPAMDTWLGGYEILQNGIPYGRRGPTSPGFTATSLLCNKSYKWQVLAFDGENETASNELTIKTGKCAKVPPNTVIHVRPPRTTRQKSAYFHWGAVRRGQDLAHFKSQCKIGKKRWKKCLPGKTYRNLKPGYRTVRIRVGDSQGWDRTPAKVRWLVRG